MALTESQKALIDLALASDSPLRQDLDDVADSMLDHVNRLKASDPYVDFRKINLFGPNLHLDVVPDYGRIMARKIAEYLLPQLTRDVERRVRARIGQALIDSSR